MIRLIVHFITLGTYWILVTVAITYRCKGSALSGGLVLDVMEYEGGPSPGNIDF